MNARTWLVLGAIASMMGCPASISEGPVPCSCPNQQRMCREGCDDGACYPPLGMCAQECQTWEDCPGGMTCGDGLCVRTCDANNRCPSGTTCRLVTGPEGSSGQVCVYSEPSSSTDTQTP